jgi:mono/diheme cytochrome c family protein
MRKLFRWIGVVLTGLVGLLVLTFIALYLIGGARWNRIRGNYDVPAETIPLPTDQAAIMHGEHIATIWMCRRCHTEALSGETVAASALFTISFPNLTSGAGGVGATNTDQDWVRAIRHGVGHDGRGLLLMPARAFYYLSDEDLGALIAYLKSLPPVGNELPRTSLGPVGRIIFALGQLPPEAYAPDVTAIDHDAPRPVAPEPGVTVEYGQYLAHICTVCHGVNLNGQTIRENRTDYVALNLTPGGELAAWSEADFFATLRTGVTPSGRQLNDVMPWRHFGQMTDDELRAVWLYLQSLPALEQGE